ncbi:alpha/beta hydrolase [Flammeovirgaceae bacterium SG7u.111]|nr:alpha/beta hydrolase [Flammeovirgaceae bacterium SG7u.132]WPO35354.1 alpha/beta hydrolase [Flammeovirgaceae bacterium SG7u.111]
METDFLRYKNSKIEFRKHGTGNTLLVAFHGFSDKAAIFDIIRPSLEKDFTLFAISFPYHGATDWQEGHFTKNDIAEIIQLILQKEKKERFALMGYSMGGKVTLNMIPFFAEKLEKVILLAPDGIKTHPLYDVNALPDWYMNLFKTLLKAPKLFFKLTKLLYKWRILSKFLYDFTINHFSTEQQRKRFFYVSASIKTFKPDLLKVKQLLNQQQISTSLFLGKRDEVIPPVVGPIFSEGLERCKVHYLPKGHLLIDEELNDSISESIETPTASL